MAVRRPADIAKRVADARDRRKVARNVGWADAFRRVTFTLPRADARTKAREMFDRYPKTAYMTEIESWRELPDGAIEFTVRRLPTAD